ncbi:MAG: stearoyl-CoA desaturase (delta-9 desaturase) [Myxococcota bacterium]
MLNLSLPVVRAAVLGAWHVFALIGVVLFPPSWSLAALALAVYIIGMFAITAGYHRYFSHKSFRTSRAGQLVLAVLAQSTLQKGVLWWAANHRDHHIFSDSDKDIHSPRHHGLLHAHMGWVVSNEGQGHDARRIRDLMRVPELRWLDRYHTLPPIALAVGMFLVGGLPGLVWGFTLPLLLLQHATFSVNSVAHVWGRRPYATNDTSRNNALLAVLTLGEGWHNNHHFYSASARQGFLWWQIDPTFQVLRVLSWLGIVWDLKVPPERVLAARYAEDR